MSVGTKSSASPWMNIIGRVLLRTCSNAEADDFVPTDMVYPLYEAKEQGDKELWVVPGAAHALSYRDNREEYTRRVKEFVGKYIE